MPCPLPSSFLPEDGVCVQPSSGDSDLGIQVDSGHLPTLGRAASFCIPHSFKHLLAFFITENWEGRSGWCVKQKLESAKGNQGAQLDAAKESR